MRQLSDCLIILLSIIFLCWLEVFQIKFGNDLVIILEGGYRVLLGQLPYRDFFIPIGPVTFYLQAFFENLVGPNLHSFALHNTVLISILAVFIYPFASKRWAAPANILLCILFFFSFNELGHPWYSQMPYFFLLMNIMVLFRVLDKKKLPGTVLVVSSVLASLSFFSKQDVGLLHLFLLGLFFIFFPALCEKVYFFTSCPPL